MDKKNQQSKSQFGTLTAKSDANNDYSQGSTSSTATSGMSGTSGSTFGSNPRSTGTTSGLSGTTATTGSTMGGTANQTLTSAYDPNDQYNKKGNQQNQQGTTTQAGQKKPK